jgi:CO/xanthine dehydrogenase Mo-binding subunit
VVVNQVTYEGHSTPAYAFGTQMAQVEVDRKTGQVQVLRMGGAHDCGIAINPMHAEGQLEGATAGGLGQTFYENLLTERGLVMNPSFLEYKIPTALDVPEIRTDLVEDPDPEGPFGAKGMSEGCQIAPAPAIANAIYHAVGVRVRELPITPEKILEGLKEKEE